MEIESLSSSVTPDEEILASMGGAEMFLSSFCTLATCYLYYSPMGETRAALRHGIGFADKAFGPLIAMWVNACVWAIYGVTSNVFAIYAPNLFGVACATFYCFAYLKDATQINPQSGSMKMAACCAILVAIVVLYAWNGASDEDAGEGSRAHIGLLGGATALLQFSSPLASAQKVIQHKNSDFMSLPLTLAGCMCSLSWCLYGVAFLHDANVIVPNSLGLFASLVQVYLILRYPAKKREMGSPGGSSSIPLVAFQ